MVRPSREQRGHVRPTYVDRELSVEVLAGVLTERLVDANPCRRDTAVDAT
jgi:hypothetical protein